MDILKKLFPLSWAKNKDITELVIKVIVYIVMAIIAGAVLWVAGMINAWLPGNFLGGLIGWILGLIGGIVELYTVAGIVFLFLVHFNVIKE